MLLFIIIFLVSAFVQFFLPWWSMAVIAAVASYFISEKSMHAFLSGFFACGMGWLLMAIFVTLTRGSLLTDKIAGLFSLPLGYFLYLISFLLAGLVGGLAAISGNFLKQSIKKNQ